MKKERILFVVNPISGGEDKILIPSLVDKYLDFNLFDAEIVFTEYGGHARDLAQQALMDDFDIIASVGGDGTINEVASALVHSDKKMAIIPSGSGNGLARTLKIPLNKAKAIQKINHGIPVKIDSATFNGLSFFNMAGLGFDAHISALFAHHEKRGLGGYVSSILKEVKNYQSQQYKITIDGKVLEKKAFMVSIANSSQYGNNAHISPLAVLDDGLLDVCIIEPFPLYKLPVLIGQMFFKTVHQSKYVEIIQGKNIKIEREAEGCVHLDGEPLIALKQIKINVLDLSLNVLV